MSDCKDCKGCVRVELKHEPTDVLFRAGLLAARGLIAQEFERRGLSTTAAMVRELWWPSVGSDPTRQLTGDACAEALPIALAFVEKNGAARE